MVIEFRNPSASFAGCSRSASGRRKIGFKLLISAKTGIGAGRADAASNKARPAAREPVNPTAQADGCFTSAVPITLPEPCSSENTPAGSWHATAQLERKFNGKTFGFDLAPNSDDPFTGSSGAIRSFTWKLTGERPDGGHYGSMVIAYADFFQPDLSLKQVELTLEPVGALVDGSAGRKITGKLVHTADGEAIRDVPVGRYKVTARNAVPGETPVALNVRLRNVGEYQNSLIADFSSLLTTVQQMVLEVSRP